MSHRILLLAIILLSSLPTQLMASVKTNSSQANRIACLNGKTSQLKQIDLQLICPKLYHALQKQGIDKVLETPLLEKLTQRQLVILQNAISAPVNNVLLDASHLDSLLAEFYVENKKDQQKSWWDQFLEWLNNYKSEKYETEFNWLIDFLEAITPSEETTLFIIYGVFAIIIITTVILVIKELILAGVFTSKKRKPKNNQIKVLAKEDISSAFSAAEIRQLSPSEQATSLLKKVISHLIDNKELPNNQALTNKEFKQYLQQQNFSSAKPFSALLTDVEPILYGSAVPTELILENCWRNTEQIIK